MPRLLILDDDLLFCEALSTTLESEGYRVLVAHTLARARELLKKFTVDIVFIDVFLPDGNGLDLLAGLSLLPEPPEAIVVTAQGDPQGAELAITSGAWDYVQKPADMGAIILMVQRALTAHERRKQVTEFAGGLGIVAESRPMRITLLQMFDAAQSEAPVLISGETGTGKELMARAVHKNGSRASGPFVVVDCGAIAPTLLESELFGNVRGAFTGAVHARHGLVSLADKGTLFLDEVGELPKEQQKVFLRLLQERSFRPIGGTEEMHSDFRVVAATNRNLAEMAAAGTFRQDLLFRLQGVIIDVPPVRSRGEDVALLVQHALSKTLARYGMKEKTFSADALEALNVYSWPGNVRELLHTVEAAALAAHDASHIHLQHLPVHLRAHAARFRVTERAPLQEGDAAPHEEALAARRELHAPAPDALAADAPAPGPGLFGPTLSVPDASVPAASLPAVAGPDPSGPDPALPSAPFPNAPFPDASETDATGPALPVAEPAAVPGSSAASFSSAAAAAPDREQAAFLGTWKDFQEQELFDHKRRYLIGLLRHTGGRVPEAATLAGLSRQRLYSLLKEHGIARQWKG